MKILRSDQLEVAEDDDPQGHDIETDEAGASLFSF